MTALRFEADYSGMIHFTTAECVVEVEVVEDKVIEVPDNWTASTNDTERTEKDVDSKAESKNEKGDEKSEKKDESADETKSEKEENGKDGADKDGDKADKGE